MQRNLQNEKIPTIEYMCNTIEVYRNTGFLSLRERLYDATHIYNTMQVSWHRRIVLYIYIYIYTCIYTVFVAAQCVWTIQTKTHTASDFSSISIDIFRSLCDNHVKWPFFIILAFLYTRIQTTTTRKRKAKSLNGSLPNVIHIVWIIVFFLDTIHAATFSSLRSHLLLNTPPSFWLAKISKYEHLYHNVRHSKFIYSMTRLRKFRYLSFCPCIMSWGYRKRRSTAW